MTSRTGSIERIVALTHEAGLDAGTWNTVIDEVSRFVGSPSGVLFSPIPGLPEPLLAANNEQWRESLAEYEAHWMALDPWILAVARQNRFVHAGETLTGTELVARDEYHRTAFFNEFGRRSGIGSMLSLRIADGSDDSLAPVTMISLLRDAGHEEFGSAEKERLSACWPHLRRGLETHWAFCRARRFHGAVEGTLDAMAQPVWVLRADARIDYANTRARQLMHSAPWFVSAGGRVLRIGDLDQPALLQALAPQRVDAARTWIAACAERGRLRRAVLRVAPLTGVEPYASAWPHARALLALELEPEPDAASWLVRLATHHRLTPAEVRVLERLAAGATLDQIAGEQHVARTTVRTHLRALFDKLGVRRQAELVRVALAG